MHNEDNYNEENHNKDNLDKDNHTKAPQNEVSGYQFNCRLPSMRSVFSGVIDPKPNLSCENESFLEKKTHLQGLINQTYKFVEDRIIHDKVITFLKTFR